MRRIRTIFFALFLAAAVFLLLLYHIISDRAWWGEWVTIWPPALWAFPLAVLAALSLDKGRMVRAGVTLFILAVFIILGLWMESPRFMISAPLNPPRGALRIVTWNVNGAPGGVKALAETLRGFDADVCLLQESPDPSNVWDLLQPEDLNWSALHVHDMGDCAALSRHPIAALPSGRVGPWDPPQVLRLDLPSSQTLLLVNVRLMLPSLLLNPLSGRARATMKSDHAARLAQYEKLAALIESRRSEINPIGVILAGDFNTPARMASLRPLRAAGLRDVWPASGAGWGATMTAQFPVARIDQCWVSERVTPRFAFVPDSAYSDHLPLVVDFDVTATGDINLSNE